MSDDTDDRTRAMANAVAREFPPLLNIEHQELIRAVERAQVNIAANRELLESKIGDLGVKLDERYAMQTEALKAALEAAEKAVDKANIANEKRFESVNEFRGQLNDIVTTLISRAEADARLSALDARLNEMKSTVDTTIAGRTAVGQTQTQLWGYLVGFVGILSVAVTIILAFSN